jgi:NAD(P)-dependent dehydrogenase (short-subunit alcohol dehydrogenase family)
VTTALVTGAGRGIGRAIALRLAQAGLAVGVTDLDGGTAAGVAAEIVGAGGHATGVAADVTAPETLRAAVAAIEAGLGPIGVLVNNAGWDQFHFFIETEPAFWDRVIAVNYRGVLAATHAVLPGMVARRAGRIVSIASDAGRVGSTGESVYSGCKAAVIGFSKALAREVARYGITVNAVAPARRDGRRTRRPHPGEREADHPARPRRHARRRRRRGRLSRERRRRIRHGAGAERLGRPDDGGLTPSPRRDGAPGSGAGLDPGRPIPRNATRWVSGRHGRPSTSSAAGS